MLLCHFIVPELTLQAPSHRQNRRPCARSSAAASSLWTASRSWDDSTKEPTLPIWKPMSILIMALLSLVSTVAHIECLQMPYLRSSRVRLHGSLVLARFSRSCEVYVATSGMALCEELASLAGLSVVTHGALWPSWGTDLKLRVHTIMTTAKMPNLE